jgi:hypothetical protein
MAEEATTCPECLMRPDRTVYVVGAGFSADAGIPTIGSFLQTAREYFDAPTSPLPGYLEPHYETVLRFRQTAKQSRDSLRLDLDNIETLFSLIDMISLSALRSSGARRTADSIKHVIAHTVTVSRRPGGRCEVFLEKDRLSETRLSGSIMTRVRDPNPPDSRLVMFDLPEYWYVAALVGGLFERGDRQVADAVISFNYDTVLEEAIWALGGDVDYGVSRVHFGGQRTRGNPLFTTPLYKLHGSSNWATTGTRGVRAKIYDSYPEFGETVTPLVVPPTWKKGDLAPLFAEIWKGAREALARATRICIIGYSMPVTDPFFHHLMGAALGENGGLYRVDVVDVNQGIFDRYGEVFEPLGSYKRLHFHTGGLSGFLARGPQLTEATGRGAVIREVRSYGA